MASSGGGLRVTDEIPEVEMEIVEPEEPTRVGSKRIRYSPNGTGSRGFCGVTTEKKASISNHTHMNSDGTSQTGRSSLHGKHGTLPDFNTLRPSITSPGENLGSKMKRPTQKCTFYNQGRCNKGNGCTFLHEIEGPGSDFRWNNEKKAGVLAADAYGNSKGSGEGSQFKDSDGLTKDKFLRSLVHLHGADKQSTFTPGVSQGMSSRFDDTLTKKLTTPRNELVPSPLGNSGCHTGLISETYLNDRGTFPRLLDRGILHSPAEKGTYLGLNYTDSKLHYQPFDLSIPSDPLQLSENFSAYVGTTGNLPNTHHKEHLSSVAPYSSYNLPEFRNPLYATPDHSFGSPTSRLSSHLGRLSQHLSSPVIEKVGSHKYVDVGTSTSRPALLASSSSQPSTVAPGSFSPVKDELWVTSVPFVPSFDYPDIKTPPRKKQYDPFVDYIDSPKDDKKNNVKSSSISIQHTNPYDVTPNSLNHDGKLARNLSTKKSDEVACQIASDRGRSSSLDDNNNRVKVDRNPVASSFSEKTRNFRFCLANHIKELLAPDWFGDYLSKDAHKLIVKKSIEKVLSSIEPDLVPTSEEAIANYITISKSKIENLVKAYLDRYRRP